jgi:hypothetical protein
MATVIGEAATAPNGNANRSNETVAAAVADEVNPLTPDVTLTSAPAYTNAGVGEEK